eukprot:TRINITY_DN6580_c0_g1_i1.p1 TRINITY_DN6580_c0_g1~~TRINITY_DN6580_c0_g1_i1.p1  ORF type:complete len:238 (+),score=13.61 TRINITY_DN6580_c0_g1_i1:71-784(+)
MDEITEAELAEAHRMNDVLTDECEALSRELRMQRLLSSSMASLMERRRHNERTALESRVRRDVEAQEQRIAERQRDKLQGAPRPIATDANSLVNHLCHSRGIQMPEPRYQTIEPQPDRGARSTLRCNEYICTQTIEVDGQVHEFVGEKAQTKKDARTSSSVKLLLSVQGCQSLEEVKLAIQEQLLDKRRRKAELPWTHFKPGRAKGRGKGKGSWGRGGRGSRGPEPGVGVPVAAGGQ